MSESRPTPISRRTFLLAAAAGVVGSAAYLGGCSDSSDKTVAKLSWSEWLVDSRNRAAIRRLGDAYLAAHPGESDIHRLRAAIDEAVNAAPSAGTDDASAAEITALQQRVRSEYRTGEVVAVQSWVVSVTEARLYVLVALESA